MPAHNEAALLDSTVGAILRGVRARGLTVEVLVVENGSTDATRTLAADLAAREPEVVMRSRPVADYGEAIRDGILTATGDVVVLFDVDYYDLEFLDCARSRAWRPRQSSSGRSARPGPPTRGRGPGGQSLQCSRRSCAWASASRCRTRTG